jgi:hypothetical protein
MPRASLAAAAAVAAALAAACAETAGPLDPLPAGERLEARLSAAGSVCTTESIDGTFSAPFDRRHDAGQWEGWDVYTAVYPDAADAPTLGARTATAASAYIVRLNNGQYRVEFAVATGDDDVLHVLRSNIRERGGALPIDHGFRVGRHDSSGIFAEAGGEAVRVSGSIGLPAAGAVADWAFSGEVTVCTAGDELGDPDEPSEPPPQPCRGNNPACRS